LVIVQEETVDSRTMMLVAIVAIAVIALVVAFAYRNRRRRQHLRERFGPEYDHAVRTVGTTGRAEAVLEERERRVEKFKIRPLQNRQAEAFAQEWRRVQARFVDDPDGAVGAADRLVSEVMAARGYPLEDFDTRAADLSVDHPRVVENYRTARVLAERRSRGEAGTEELRQAVVNYRALFDDLLETDDTRSVRGRIA
jgi:FtsZ-interacting cell division protein ZipA